MNKKEFVRVVSEKCGLTQTEANAAVDAIFETIIEAARRSDSVSIPGFGTFKIKNVAEHEARNPKTGEAITVHAFRKLAFVPGKDARRL